MRSVIPTKTYEFAGSSPVGTVSVGAENAERTITNVAAGRISSTSTDAINGSQLYAITAAIDALQSIDLDSIQKQLAQPTVSAGTGVTVSTIENKDGSKNYVINANGTTIRGGENVIISGDAVNGYTISAEGGSTTIKAGDNVSVTGDRDNGFTISATDTNTQATVSSGQGVIVTATDNANGTKNLQRGTECG